MGKIEAYRCEKCALLMESNDVRLRTIEGHIYFKLSGGSITAGEKKDTNIKHYCVSCLVNIIEANPSIHRQGE